MTGIIHYGAGNVFSVLNTIERCGEKTCIVSKPRDLLNVDRIILPGVGAFDEGMGYLEKNNLVDALLKEIKKGKILLGICLGMQMFFEKSEEGELKGIGLMKGCVKKFPENKNLCVPHMGWNSIKLVRFSDFTKDIPDESFFYFAHSFYTLPKDKDVIYGVTEYGLEFASIVQSENIIGVQFHPEKSGNYGLTLIKNFLRMS
ncbi:MAG: imidazole glycerol phosphate synthase subunit HisH [Candidatus Omnitrophica bacterium]|nr:imidazole glycerol phosphate synthase subunit HisH [Candidatus Omnitrophota bacterium]MCM8816045.1 imidazole glycerol phosphate synthase subunit HisH [Candidatus Omnitrophota bacterium]